MFSHRELDPAIFRRLEKRIFVDLPDALARKDMFEYYLSQTLRTNKYIKCQIDCEYLAQVNIIIPINYAVRRIQEIKTGSVQKKKKKNRLYLSLFYVEFIRADFFLFKTLVLI